VSLRLIRDRDHYGEIIERGIRGARTSVWVATANLKDVHVEAPIGTRARARGRYVSLFEELGDLGRRGVEVRILHAGPPSRALTARLGTTRGAKASQGVTLRRCVRVHLKLIAVDGALLYLGSANFTGAGLGAKGDDRRNFETGVVTDDDLLLDEMQGAFEAIWSGSHCKTCRVRTECPLPIDTLLARRKA
jgi:phosphatidylserine/phosphatidylglycerophosphate/cardiolipin synthase-like enzyme